MRIYIGCFKDNTRKSCFIRIETQKYIRYINFYDKTKLWDIKKYRDGKETIEKKGTKWINIRKVNIRS